MKQVEVIEKLKAGWELRKWQGINGHWDIADPKSIERITVYTPTACKLVQLNKVIPIGDPFPIQSYKWLDVEEETQK